MRISELTALSGMPMATVKYYLREGLLHPGRRETARLSEYDGSHVNRLTLLQILRDVGELPVGKLRELVAAVENPRLSIHQVLGKAADATAPSPREPGPHHETARALADALIAEAGWTGVRPEAVDRASLTAVLEVVDAFAPGAMSTAALRPYLMAADDIGRLDVGSLDYTKERTDLLEDMVIGQVVFGRLLMILRRLAEEHHSFERFADAR